MRAHLYIETDSGEVLIDEDVNDVQIDSQITWRKWEPGQKSQADEWTVSISHLAKIELTPCRDRLKHELAE